jgi:hypothetical protein
MEALREMHSILAFRGVSDGNAGIVPLAITLGVISSCPTPN